MKLIIPKRFWRWLNILFFTAIFAFLVYNEISVESLAFTDPYRIGDWLINYQGGFVRRGLMGEILLILSQWSSFSEKTLVITLQLVLYAIFCINTCRLSMNSTFSPLNAALIFSPAFMLFPIRDPLGGYRKEILLFALLSALCCYVLSIKKDLPKSLPFFIGIISVIFVLSHEMLIVYFPYIVGVFIIHEKGLGSTSKKIILSMIPAVITAVYIIFNGVGDQQTIMQICQSIKENATVDCLDPNYIGAIAFVGLDLKAGHDFVVRSLTDTTPYVYLITGLFSLLPLILFSFRGQFSKLFSNSKLKIGLVACISIAIIGSLPLFLIVADYGRLIYIQVTCLTLLVLMLCHDTSDDPLIVTSRQLISWILCLFFIFGWRLVHWRASFHSAFPVINLIERIFK